MLSIDVTTAPLASSSATLVAVGVFSAASGEREDPPEPAPGAAELAEAAGLDLVEQLRGAGFDPSVGNTLRMPAGEALDADALVVVGLGAREDCDLEVLRRAAGAIANAAERVDAVATSLPGVRDDELDAAAAVQSVAEGLGLGAYRFSLYRSDPRPFELGQATLHVSEAAEQRARQAVEVASVMVDSASLARDLVNIPPQDKRPPALAERARAEVDGLPVEVTVLDEHALRDGGYGGLLGVGQGSSEPPRLVQLDYAPADATSHVAIVGKGITFDTGGISLKPSSAMETMKMDMAGAASALAVIRGAAQLGLPVRVTALLALAENMPSGSATRVSDVLTLRDGTTVEVINTDAEGRLVLADALAHASAMEPDAIVDVATLTGAAVIALGDRIGVLMASDDQLADGLLRAASDAGEPHWRLPVASEQYGERLEGTIADMKNAAGREAGTIFAGLFLHRFVGADIPWAHLDIAGVAWTKEASGYLSVGATGVPVRSLLGWLRTHGDRR